MEHESDNERESPSVCHLLIPSRSRCHVLAKEVGHDVLQLPRVEVPAVLESSQAFLDPVGFREIEVFIGSRLGLDVHMFEDIWTSVENEDSDEGDSRDHCIRLMHLCDEHPNLAGSSFKWIPRTTVPKCKWIRMHPDDEEVDIPAEAERVLSEMGIAEPWERYRVQPWVHVGWYYIATSWIDDVLRARGMIRKSPIRETCRQLQSLVMACKVKIRFDGSQLEEMLDELFYIKTVCPVFREVHRTAAIARVVGDVVPEVIAINERWGMMILRDGGAIMDEPLDQAALIDTIAKMQRLSMSRIRELEVGGLRVMDSEWLACNVESILHHAAFDDKRCVYDADGREDNPFRGGLQRLRSSVGQLERSFRDVARLSLPNTIVHGDLGLQNIGSRKNSGGELYCIFDWAKSFVGHPLYDFVDLLMNDRIWPGLPQCAINYETALPLVSQLWMPSATSDEVKSIFEVTQVMRDAIEIDHLTQQYDALKDEERGYSTIEDLKTAVMDMLTSSAVLAPTVAEDENREKEGG